MTVETDIKKYSLNYYNRIITRYYERLSNEEDYDNLINIENKIASNANIVKRKNNKPNKKITISNIISLLKKQGINSKQKVIDLLENASWEDLIYLSKDCRIEAGKRAIIKANSKKIV